MFRSLTAFLPAILPLAAGLTASAQTNTPMGVHTDWVRLYDSGIEPAFDFSYAIAVDPSGNVIVTGSSYGPDQLPDFVTIKYNSAGNTEWVRRYNGPGNNWDIARDLAIDDLGNVYVTGETYSSSTYFDFATIKYDASGEEQWVVLYDNPSQNDDHADDIAVDASGNVYVTGQSSGSGTSYDYATIKYNNLGQEQWVARFNGPGNTNDQPSALGIDASGNVYVTGASGEGSPNLSDYVTVKYNSSGVQQWVGRYSSWYDYATAIAVSESGDVVVTGRSYDIGTYYDYATVKYNTMGVQQWARRYHGGLSDDFPYAIAMDPSGNVYVTGEGGPDTVDYATVKYNAAGVEQWVATYNGPGNTVDRGFDIDVDASGNVYVTGESRRVEGDDDFATVKYTSSGAELWATRYTAPGESYDLGAALALDESGNVYVTGRSAVLGGSTITTIKYVQDAVSVQNVGTDVPAGFALGQNYPNPCNLATSFAVHIPRTEFVSLSVLNVRGERVATLVNHVLQPGRYDLTWDTGGVASGVYFYKLQAGGAESTRRMLVVR